MNGDLFMYRWLSYMMEKAFDLPIYWSIEYTEKNLRKETNFLTEANNSIRAKEE